ncbi:MAG TPA: DUF3280 domain-containing protein [Methylocella sp.]|nr:DUF3280 domain-containing protein [Methylocella sp.]
MGSDPAFKFKTAFALAMVLSFGKLPLSVSALGESVPTKIAVFDFELVDASAGAGVAGDPDVDANYLSAVNMEVRRVVEESGRYRLIDVSGADAEAARNHSLRHCNGCEAKIAAALGADQSLLGTVKRISRTEYVVGYELREAKSGTLIAAEDTGLRMGAGYSWSRGASRLIATHLLGVR